MKLVFSHNSHKAILFLTSHCVLTVSGLCLFSLAAEVNNTMVGVVFEEQLGDNSGICVGKSWRA